MLQCLSIYLSRALSRAGRPPASKSLSRSRGEMGPALPAFPGVFAPPGHFLALASCFGAAGRQEKGARVGNEGRAPRRGFDSCRPAFEVSGRRVMHNDSSSPRRQGPPAVAAAVLGGVAGRDGVMGRPRANGRGQSVKSSPQAGRQGPTLPKRKCSALQAQTGSRTRLR